MDLSDGEIYVITSPNGKNYVGQVRCFVLNRGKRIYKGTRGRWAQHISEAFSQKKKQCFALNNAIKKYGASRFTVRRLMICDLTRLDFYELYFVNAYDGLSPKGYNLTPGGQSCVITDEIKKKISDSVTKYFADPANRRKQSERQLAVTHRKDYKRKKACGFELPRYVTYFERKDGRKGFAVNYYKTKRRSYFSTNDPGLLQQKFEEAVTCLARLNGQSAAKIPEKE